MNKLLEQDIVSVEQTQNHFYPFINSCNESQAFLKIINDEEIINCNYKLLMVPKGCIQQGNDLENSDFKKQNQLNQLNQPNKICILSQQISDLILIDLNFIDMKDNERKREKAKAIEISDKINSFACPECWYKTGDLSMSCKDYNVGL